MYLLSHKERDVWLGNIIHITTYLAICQYGLNKIPFSQNILNLFLFDMIVFVRVPMRIIPVSPIVNRSSFIIGSSYGLAPRIRQGITKANDDHDQ